MNNLSPQYTLQPKPWIKRWWGVLIIIFIAIFLIIAFAVFFQTLQLIKEMKEGKLMSEQPIGQNFNQSLVTDDDAYLGNKEAPITIVEFGDFACPYCRQSAPVLRQLLQIYPQKIKIVWKHFPILGEQSVLAAQASACAQEQGNLIFWALHDQLFDNQEDLSINNIRILAKKLGVDLKQFNNCLAVNRYQSRIKNDLLVGQKYGAISTPTFFINGRKIEGHQSLKKWQMAIGYILGSTINQ